MTGKLYGTLGPACADTDTLRALLRAGMRGVRLNLSHGPLAERAPWLESLRRAETAEGVSCELLIDLQGPELRVGALFAPLTLREGDTLTLGEAFPVPPILTGNLQDGDELLLDDGALSLRVLDARAMTCRVERGGCSDPARALPSRAVSCPRARSRRWIWKISAARGSTASPRSCSPLSAARTICAPCAPPCARPARRS